MGLHTHTDVSYNCEMSVGAVLARAAAVSLNVATITDHDSVGALPRAFNTAHEYGVRVVPGAGVSTADGYLLALGVDDPPVTRQLLPETVRKVREADGLAVMSYPFQMFRHGASRRVIRNIDAIEAYDAHTLTGFRSGQVRHYARRQGPPSMGGSDVHRPALVGQVYTAVSTEADGDVTTDATLEGIRVGRTVVCGTQTTTHQYLQKYALNTQLRATSFL